MFFAAFSWSSISMSKLAYLGLAAVVLVAPARAADMAVKAPPPPVVLPFNWNGFYVGGFFGGGQLSDTVTAVGTVNSTNFPAGTLFKEPAGGLLGGVEAGYNWQLQNWVLGVEGDFSWTNITANDAIGSVVTTTIVAHPSPDVRDLATVTGRFGYTFGDLLLFGKAGWAWANTTDNAFTTNGTTTILTQTASETRSGWTVGGGLELGFLQNWSVKFEGDYIGFGTRTSGSLVTFGNAQVPTGSILLREHDTNIWVLKAGVNYHFNWGAAPLVAKY
jgi:outer membrane immunogenic protein